MNIPIQKGGAWLPAFKSVGGGQLGNSLPLPPPSPTPLMILSTVYRYLETSISTISHSFQRSKSDTVHVNKVVTLLNKWVTHNYDLIPPPPPPK